MKHYMDIERLKPQYADGFEKGDVIVIQEKIDGANFSIRYDEETNTIKAFSRKKELDMSNNLRGAWEWSQKLDVERVKNALGTRYILFMEWLVSHTVPYPQDKYQNAYAYDVYDTVEEKYLLQGDAYLIADSLGITYVPVFYIGEFTSWDDVKEYVGKTQMGGEYGEGIVVKNQTKLNNPNTRLPFYTKIVCEQFCETKGHRDSKPVDLEKLNHREKIISIVDSVVTEARVRKILHKFVDDGIIPEDWDEKSMGIIAKNIGRAVYYDCVKEESDIVSSVGDGFGKFANSTAMKITKKILGERTYV